MKQWLFVLSTLLLVFFATIPAYAQEAISLPTSQGELQLVPLGHGSLMIVFGGQTIYVDPYSRVYDYSKLPKADQIWITHEHADHLDQNAIDAVRRSDTVIVADPRSAEKLGGSVLVMRNGDQQVINGVTLSAVPAYNLVQERSPGVKYHPKGWYNGYVATFGNVRVYVAGDTEAIPEMGQLGPIDVAFVPINLPFTMPPEEAAAALKVISPKIAVPYHQGESDPKVVAELLKGSGIEVKVFSLP